LRSAERGKLRYLKARAKDGAGVGPLVRFAGDPRTVGREAARGNPGCVRIRPSGAEGARDVGSMVLGARNLLNLGWVHAAPQRRSEPHN
jgi:hypothetical protein